MTTKAVEVLVDCEIAADLHLMEEYYHCQGCCQISKSVYSIKGAVYKCRSCDSYYHFDCLKPGDKNCRQCGANAVDLSFCVQEIVLNDWITVVEQVDVYQETEEQSSTEDTVFSARDRKRSSKNERPENSSYALEASQQVSTTESPTDDSVCRNLYEQLSLEEDKEQAQKQPTQQKQRRAKRDRSLKRTSAKLKDAAMQSSRQMADKSDGSENDGENDYPAEDQVKPNYKNQKIEKEENLSCASFFRQYNRISEEKTEIDEPHYDDSSSEGTAGREQRYHHQGVSGKEDMEGYQDQHNEEDADSSVVVYIPQDTTPAIEDNRLDLCSLNVKTPAEIVMDDVVEYDPSHPFPATPVFDLMLASKKETEVVLKIPGPDPKMGRIPLNKLQIQEVEDQGQLISGDITSAYLGLLSQSPLLLDEKDPKSKHNSHHDNRRFFKFAATSDFVWTSLKRSREEMKSWGKAWIALDKNRGRRKPHCNLVDDRETVTALQIFEGNCHAGHFACLIIDRRVLRDGIFTYFDSGKRFGYTSMAMMKECFEGSQLAANKNSIWIEAELPQQGSKTMDCGVWMCILIASFLRSLKEKNGCDVPGGLQIYKKVKVRISPSSVPQDSTWYRVGGSISTKLLGWFGRAHIRESLFREKIHKSPIVLSMLEYEVE